MYDFNVSSTLASKPLVVSRFSIWCGVKWLNKGIEIAWNWSVNYSNFFISTYILCQPDFRYLLPYELHELRSVDVDKTLISSKVEHRKHAKKRHKKHTKHPKQATPNRPSKQAMLIITNQECLTHRPFTTPAQHNIPIPGLGQTCQPVIGETAVTYQPVGGFHQPITTQSQCWYPIADEEKSERAQIGSQGQPCLTPTPHYFPKGTCTIISGEALCYISRRHQPILLHSVSLSRPGCLAATKICDCNEVIAKILPLNFYVVILNAALGLRCLNVNKPVIISTCCTHLTKDPLRTLQPWGQTMETHPCVCATLPTFQRPSFDLRQASVWACDDICKRSTAFFPEVWIFIFCTDADASEGLVDVDYLQEESNQALIELKVMEEMLSSLDNQEGKNSTSGGHGRASLDKPTHYGKSTQLDPILWNGWHLGS